MLFFLIQCLFKKPRNEFLIHAKKKGFKCVIFSFQGINLIIQNPTIINLLHTFLIAFFTLFSYNETQKTFLVILSIMPYYDITFLKVTVLDMKINLEVFHI